MDHWVSPLPYHLIATDDAMSFRSMPVMTTGIPVANHPGAFGVRRKFHWHEGVDMYVPVGTPVSTVEPGVVVGVVPFTGVHAGAEFSIGLTPGLSWLKALLGSWCMVKWRPMFA